jgi:predicted RNase H-like nuclease (RuvC/YqgF family)
LIYGVDIASGSPKSKQPPSYALFILEGDREERHPMISRQKLIRMIRQTAPDMVATDNVHELAASKADLVRLLRGMPPSTKLVQVTGGERPEALAKIARWHGISFDRQNPMDEAETCARLAARGVGSVVSAFEDRTWIKVSRRRSPGRGGWSQKRYTRKIHGSVKALSREVEGKLREEGHQFSARSVEGIGGYIRSEFVVEAPRNEVHLHSGYRGDAQIRVEGVERPRLKFEPLRSRRGYIIAGIDPGTTTGIAALNLKGELVALLSARAMSPPDVIEWLAERGKPLVVATDVFPTPGAVEKVKRSFSAVLYSPGSDIPSEGKIALAREYGYKNDHERDALAAAVSAYKRYKNKFQQVEKKCPPSLDPEEVKALVVRGLSIDQAISGMTELPSEEPAAPKEVEPEVASDLTALMAENRRQANQIRRLKEYTEELKGELSKDEEIHRRLEAKIERLKDKSRREIKRDQEIRIREKEIERLRALLRQERKVNRKLKARLKRAKKAEELEEKAVGRPVKEVASFSREALLEAASRLDIKKGDVVVLKDASGGGPNTSDLFIDWEVEAVIIETEMEASVEGYLMDGNVPVISSREVPVRRVADIALVDPDELEMALARWAERRQVRVAKQKTEWLEGMIQEYRAERRKDERQRRKKAEG